MAQATIQNTRGALRAETASAIKAAIVDRAETIEGGPLDGIRVASLGNVDQAISAVLTEPLPPFDSASAEVTTGRTPARVVVWAECPACGIRQSLAAEITASLTVDATSRELKLRAKSKGRTHVCGQTAIEEGPGDGQESFELEDIIGADAEPGEDVAAAEDEPVAEAPDNTATLPFRPQVGDTLVIGALTFRITSLDATTYHAKAQGAKDRAAGAIDLLVFDEDAGVWRERPEDDELLPE